MATESVSGTPTLFLRNATGLVRGWSVRDSMIYACLSTNVVTLGIYEFSYQSFIPKGQLLTSVLISAVWVSFLVIAYAGLIVTIPRAGGDYVWQTRILGSGVGFVLAATGWWFILWLWAPIYGNILSVELFQPLWATFGDPGGATWFATKTGIFVVCLITIAVAGILVSLGMAGYARIQKYCFYAGLIGFAVVVILLLVSSKSSFISSFDTEAHKIFGVSNAYAATTSGAAKSGYVSPAFGFGPLGASMLLVPMMMFYLLWPNWGSTLYGEIRGASDFKRVFTGMFSGLWITVILSVIFLLLVAKTFGTAFYNDSNALYWSAYYGGKIPAAIPIWPYPVMFAGWLVHNAAFQAILILLMSVWFFGWVGTLFLSSTRVIFAAAFDRVLPDRAAEVSEKRQVPFYSLILMLLPAAVLSAVYAYWLKFETYTLDATLVIAVTYLFSAIAVVILPWRKPDLWRASPASRFKIAGVPIVPVAGVVTIGLLGYNLYEWLSNDAYGVNNKGSLVFMGILYVLAIVVYVTARIVRSRQGIDLGLINKEIPVE
ncbi:MAG TPA: APC family permease [Candidatus Sulfotelmatobacter sp.]|nr:APC family permease [Candidatus Sulfotelmatobacter sp.]